MYAPASLGKFYAKLHDAYPRTKNGGAIGDARHVRGGGYHISPALLRANGMGSDYSLLAPLDNAGPRDAVSGQDWTFLDQTGAQGIQTVSKRLMKIFKERDPRVIAACREWFGTTDGKNVTGYSAYRDRVVTSSDRSHIFHDHFSLWRERCDDWTTLSAFADAIIGVPLNPTVPAAPPAPEKYVPDSRVVYLDRLTAGRQNSDSVAWIQTALNKVLDGPDVVITADYDAATVAAAKRFQTQMKDKTVDGLLGPLGVAALLKQAKMTNRVEARA